MEPVTACVALTRAQDYFGMLCDLRIFIDNEEVGRIPYGGRHLFPLAPGAHSVWIEMDWCRSRPYEVYLEPGSTVELEGGIKYRGLLWSLSLFACFCPCLTLYVVRPMPEVVQRKALGCLATLASFVLTLLLALLIGLGLVLLLEDMF